MPELLLLLHPFAVQYLERPFDVLRPVSWSPQPDTLWLKVR
jgi:hypothetical protein